MTKDSVELLPCKKCGQESFKVTSSGVISCAICGTPLGSPSLPQVPSEAVRKAIEALKYFEKLPCCNTSLNNPQCGGTFKCGNCKQNERVPLVLEILKSTPSPEPIPGELTKSEIHWLWQNCELEANDTSPVTNKFSALCRMALAYLSQRGK